ncbi:hypothetical protein BGV71_14575 [Burkholderia ubonensis]|nr:hypothetical protein WJ82_13740 [Burkholderia ubonensis]KVU18761.1 hypothetical protein WK64_06550 [Burkholderia ubonensis]OJA81766.1 hypothetical protein BGV71_14575 [Burkholderia ubonensis]OJB14810.1 hypothetical protein BGV54_24850 [Burkholderia ubonensis]
MNNEPRFNLDFLFVRIVLMFVVNIPSDCFEQRIDEVLARFGLLIGWQQILAFSVSRETIY